MNAALHTGVTGARRPLGFVLCAWALGASCTAGEGPDAQLAQQLDAVLSNTQPLVLPITQQMPELGRRLLAARAYLRAGDTLDARWSWTADEFKAFNASAEGLALQRAVAEVQCTFSSANPGYELFVNPEFRTLDIQLERWNRNASVGRAAAHLLDSLRAEWRKRPVDAAAATASGDRWLQQWLSAHAPHPVPTLAAPGLSPHGRGSAVDFQVRRDGKLIAGPDSATVAQVWDGAGWGRRLAQAVAASRAPFEGPLQSPREPWHYRYAPAAAQTSLPVAGCAGMPGAARQAPAYPSE